MDFLDIVALVVLVSHFLALKDDEEHLIQTVRGLSDSVLFGLAAQMTEVKQFIQFTAFEDDFSVIDEEPLGHADVIVDEVGITFDSVVGAEVEIGDGAEFLVELEKVVEEFLFISVDGDGDL